MHSTGGLPGSQHLLLADVCNRLPALPGDLAGGLRVYALPHRRSRHGMARPRSSGVGDAATIVFANHLLPLFAGWGGSQPTRARYARHMLGRATRWVRRRRSSVRAGMSSGPDLC